MIIRILLFPVVLLLVLYFVIAHLVPTAKSITVIKDQIVTETDNLQKATDQLNRAIAFEQEVQTKTKEQEFMMDFVPNDEKEEILLSDISQLAEMSGVSLFSVGFSEGRQDVRSAAATDGKPYLIEGKMIVSGTYESMKEFMHQLFRIKRLYAFKTFDLTKIEQDELEEGEQQGDLMLNGVVSFAYDYIPGVATVSPDIAEQEINFDLIQTVMDTSSDTQPLKTETNNRKNPFLP